MHRQRIFLVVLALFGLAVWMLALAVPVAAQDGGVATVYNPNPQAPETFWTLERRQSAEPMDLVRVEGRPQQAAPFRPSGPAGRIEGTLPADLGAAAGPADESAATAGPGAATLLEGIEEQIFGGPVWYSYPPPHTRYFPRFGGNLYPHRTLGKLFFSDGMGGNFVCSGAAVVCSDQDLVMTAGHCCSDGAGFFYTDWAFVPACVGSGCAFAPFGIWNWQTATVLTAWHNSGDLARDVCWLKVAPNSGGQEIHQVVGSLGRSWDQTQPVHYHQTGWPHAAPFNGSRLVFEVASTAELDGSFTPNTVGAGNFMTGGSSGGAWIQDYKQGTVATNQYWNGLNSYKYVSPNRPQEMFGPYIDSVIDSIFTMPTICP